MSKRSFAKMNRLARTAIAVGATIACALLLCLLFARIALASEDPTANLSLYGEIAFSLSMLLCGFVGAKLGSETRFADGLLAAAITLLLVIGASILFGGTNFVKEVLLALLGCFMGAGGALLGAKEQKRRRKH